MTIYVQVALVFSSILLGTACQAQPGGSVPEAAIQAEAEAALQRAARRIDAHTDSIDAIFQPLPLLSAAQEAALRRSTNNVQLAQARRAGIPPVGSPAEQERLEREGRLVPLEQSTPYWVVRELDYSVALVTPATKALLNEIGERFHSRLTGLGVPPLRMEISSALRTAESHSALRSVNPNAARGTSAHEYGTTVDIAYNGYRAPEQPAFEEAGWLAPYARRLLESQTEAVAARRSGELRAILGQVLLDLQAEGEVLVLLEERQPVFHLTVTR